MNLFKQLSCIALVVASTTIAHAQNCKFKTDEIDGFSKERHRLENVQLGGSAFHWWMQMEQKGSKYFITYYITAIKEVHDAMPAGTQILTRLENDNVVALTTAQEILPTHNVEQAGYGITQQAVIVTQWITNVEVSEEKIKQLASSPSALIRVTINGNDYTSPEIKGKQGQKIMNLATCLLSKD